jgi:putative tricarboxylic transport membrane protein
MEHLLAILAGSLLGMAIGILPGMGILIAMIISAPFLITWAPVDIFLFYAALTQISQFTGSVTTMYTGIAGEPSGIPTVAELPRLPASQYGDTIAAAAVGSFVAAILSITACWILAAHLSAMSYFLRTELISMLFVFALIGVIKYSSDDLKTSIGLCLSGILLGLVGYNSNLETGILTFGNSSLTAGVPWDIVLLCLFTFPQLYRLSNSAVTVNHIPTSVKWPRLNYLRITQYSAVGFVGGLMPGLAMIFSSMLSYNITCRTTTDPRERIISAETANNAGAVSQLIPLIIFGLPLVPSEAIALSLMELKGFTASIASASIIFGATALLQMTVAAIGLIMAWPLVTQVLTILRTNLKLLRAGILAILVLAILYQAWLDYNMVFVLQCMVCLLILGWALRLRDTTGLIFGYFIGDKLLDYGLRLHSLYF